jgi:hypothetical protein
LKPVNVGVLLNGRELRTLRSVWRAGKEKTVPQTSRTGTSVEARGPDKPNLRYGGSKRSKAAVACSPDASWAEKWISRDKTPITLRIVVLLQIAQVAEMILN